LEKDRATENASSGDADKAARRQQGRKSLVTISEKKCIRADSQIAAAAVK